MTTLVERLREQAWQRSGAPKMDAGHTKMLEWEAADEIERLTLENWQLKQACGYPIPGDKETINNPFKCGTCDAKAIEVNETRDEIERLHRAGYGGLHYDLAEAQRQEIERLRAKNRELASTIATRLLDKGP